MADATPEMSDVFDMPEPMRVYEGVLVPRLFRPFAHLLLDEVGVDASDVVLDVACGPGTVAREAAVRAGPNGRVTGCDINPAMLVVATAKPLPHAGAHIEYVECPADALAVADGEFDVVVCQQGLQFFPDRPAAVREMRRAARSGGRLGISCWATLEETPVFALTRNAIGEVLGDHVADEFRGGPWGLSDPDELRGLVEAAGFEHVRVDRRSLPVVFEGGPDQVFETLKIALADPMGSLDDAGRQALRDAMARTLAPLTTDGESRSEAVTHIAVAVA
jgi:SAM-dependent methyltransferase